MEGWLPGVGEGQCGVGFGEWVQSFSVAGWRVLWMGGGDGCTTTGAYFAPLSCIVHLKTVTTVNPVRCISLQQKTDVPSASVREYGRQTCGGLVLGESTRVVVAGTRRASRCSPERWYSHAHPLWSAECLLWSLCLQGCCNSLRHPGQLRGDCAFIASPPTSWWDILWMG